jgi:AAHS family 4-hydroxybenzoate transporter-like MFS transporter
MIALLVRKINTEIALACALLLGGAAIFAMWYWEMTINLTSLLIFLSGMGLMGAQFGLNGLSGSVYPSDIRATGSGWALGVGRVGNIVGPGLGGLVLGLGFATKTMFLVAVVPTLIAALALLLLARERLAGRLDPASVEY